jgi:4-diphosphocytidyl-2-C-methyl-D-erythritol kinase
LLARGHKRGDNPGMTSISVAAPAKVNLFLHVTGRRADGYHTLETLFVAIDLADTITLELRADGAIRRTSDLAGVAPDADLVVRAARALQDATASPLGADIAVTKRIPLGGGLGGGSSDAASVLLGLNRLWSTRLPRARLTEIGRALGADVPFFLEPQPAFARGIGDLLVPVTLPSCWIALIVPPIPVATAGIFAAPELTRNTPSEKIEIFSEGYGRNDLQGAALARFPDVAIALAELGAHSRHARMTGSGSCVFAAFASEKSARAAIAGRMPGSRGFVARTLARHPLASFG